MLTGSAEVIERARPWVLHGMTRDSSERYEEAGPGSTRWCSRASSAT